MIQAALSFLVRDIANAASASPQEVNVWQLTRQWAADLGTDWFDGNDANDKLLHGGGLQLGACPPVTACNEPNVACRDGFCRPLCDLYVGTPRALLAGALTKVIRDTEHTNRTGLVVEDTLALARAMSDNIDPDLFGNACPETLDRLPPSLAWTQTTPGAQAFVRGAIEVGVSAVDDFDPNPRAAIVGYPDADGDPTNRFARAIIATTLVTDGSLVIAATATDLAGNTATITRELVVDNTPPVVTIDDTGFAVDGVTWWTASAAPTLHGTIVDANPDTVTATVGGTQVTGTLSGNSWSLTLPAGAVSATGVDVTIMVSDRAGNQGVATQRLRADLTPPS